MNNTYKTNKTDWRRLGRSTLLVALLMMLVGASLPAKDEARRRIAQLKEKGGFK